MCGAERHFCACARRNDAGSSGRFGSNAAPDATVAAFYAGRHDKPLWLANGSASPAVAEVMAVLQRAPLDGFASGPAYAGGASR